MAKHTLDKIIKEHSKHVKNPKAVSKKDEMKEMTLLMKHKKEMKNKKKMKEMK